MMRPVGEVRVYLRRAPIDMRRYAGAFGSGIAHNDGAATLYVTNGADNRIRKVPPTGVVSTLNAQPFIDAQ
jgi:hypothetical protein